MALFLSIPRATVRSANIHLDPPLHSSRLAAFAIAARAGASPRPIAALSSGKSKLFPSGVAPLFVRKEKVEILGRRQSFVCAALDPYSLQWISAVSTIVLMLSKGTTIHKSFLAPLFLLQAPAEVVSWMRGQHGAWTAFLALLVRLFYFIPGEIDLPFITMLLIMAAPNQALALRGAPSAAIISAAISGYLAFQHFSRAGSLRRALDQGALVASLAVICILAVSISFLIACL